MKIPSKLLTLAMLSGLASALLFTSCVPQKKIRYLQQAQAKDTTVFHPYKRNAAYKLRVGDNLYIRIYTLDEKAYLFFNKQSGSTSYNDYASEAAVYLNSYSINPDGDIDFPILGKIHVKDLTVGQVKADIQQRIGEYLKETTVVVKAVNFRVSVVGEVSRPGEFNVYKDELNVFEAIALAGDMTEYGNRGKVALIRKVQEGSQVHYLDLTSQAILSSEYYHLQPGDILYVAPLGYKRWGLGSTFPWAIALSGLTTTLLLINFFK